MSRVMTRPARAGIWFELWPTLTALGVGTALLGALFHEEVAAAVFVWIDSTAYGHCFLVLPIAAYLAWDRRDLLPGVPIRPWPGAALLALPLGVAWLAAERLGIMEGRQLVAVAFFQVLALVVLGWRMTRMLAAPLLYLFFLVPFGAFLVPVLQDFTAAFVVGGLNALGIPNVSDLYTIEIPEGTFYVAEACAGLRFLIASIAFGVLFACLNYRTWGRRAGFIAASVVVPIVANGIRALGIVVLGHILGSAEAAAVDHILYGWIFFSIVLLLLLLAGLPFRQAMPFGGTASGAWIAPRSLRPLWAAAALIALVAAGPAVSALLDARASPLATLDHVPVADVPGCVRGPETGAGPYRRSARFQCGRFPVEISIQVLTSRANPAMLNLAQRQLGGELGASEVEVHGLAVDLGDPRSWRLVETTEPAQETALNVWIDGELASGGLRGRVRQAWNSITGSPWAPVVLAIGIVTGQDQISPAERARARDVLRGFLEHQPGLATAVQHISRSAQTGQ